MATVVLKDLEARLGAAGHDVADARLALDNALKARDALIVQAVDLGMSQSQAARLVGVHPAHIVKVLARSQPDLVEG